MVVDRPPEIPPVDEDGHLHRCLQVVLRAQNRMERPALGRSLQLTEEPDLPDQEPDDRRPERPGEDNVLLNARDERHEEETERQRQGYPEEAEG